MEIGKLKEKLSKNVKMFNTEFENENEHEYEYE